MTEEKNTIVNPTSLEELRTLLKSLKEDGYDHKYTDNIYDGYKSTLCIRISTFQGRKYANYAHREFYEKRYVTIPIITVKEYLRSIGKNFGKNFNMVLIKILGEHFK